MKALVDTCVWSEALRKSSVSPLSPIVSELSRLSQEGHAVLIGMVRQEILSGIYQRSHFEWVRDTLRAFDDFPIEPIDHEKAAEYFTLCRSKGIQGSHTDFLQCALAVRHQFTIFTTDKDFTHFASHIGIKLHPIPS